MDNTFIRSVSTDIDETNFEDGNIGIFSLNFKNIPDLNLLIRYFESGLTYNEFKNEIDDIKLHEHIGGYYDKYLKYKNKYINLKKYKL